LAYFWRAEGRVSSENGLIVWDRQLLRGFGGRTLESRSRERCILEFQDRWQGAKCLSHQQELRSREGAFVLHARLLTPKLYPSRPSKRRMLYSDRAPLHSKLLVTPVSGSCTIRCHAEGLFPAFSDEAEKKLSDTVSQDKNRVIGLAMT